MSETTPDAKPDTPAPVTGPMNIDDIIAIDIPTRSIQLLVDDETLATRRAAQEKAGWYPENRDRPVSAALRAYASMALSADKGAVRHVP